MPLPVGMECVREDMGVHGGVKEAVIGHMPLCQYYRFRLTGEPIPLARQGAVVRVPLDRYESMQSLEELRVKIVQANHSKARHHVMVVKRGTEEAVLLVGFINTHGIGDINLG